MADNLSGMGKIKAPRARKPKKIRVQIDFEETTVYSRVVDMDRDLFYKLGDRLDNHDRKVVEEIFDNFIHPQRDWSDARDQEVTHFDIFKPKTKRRAA